jgi:hypothetical protein
MFTAIVVRPLAAPRPVKGADERVHLAYELSFVNETPLLVQIDGIAAVDADTGKTLAQWQGDALAAIFRINGKESGITLARSHSGYAFLDVALPAGALIPKTLKHRISTTRFMQAAGNDDNNSAPLDPKLNIPPSITFVGAPTPVDPHWAVIIAPPLRGPGWVAFNGCCDTITSHRGAIMAINGTAYAPERFAIDFIQIDKDRRMLVGPVDQLSSYSYFNVAVYAAAPGVVVETSDGAPEQIPGTTVVGPTLDNAAGNHIVIDIGDGNYAAYAHLKTGTVAVKVGDHVKEGDVIAHLGNTGNTDAPHLHFHVMDGSSPLISSGLPYEFSAFVGTGRLAPDDDFSSKGTPGKVDRPWNAGPHKDELPLNNEVVDFPAQ